MHVTSFNYQGFKNALFGRIEAHEAINAFGRDRLLMAKELAESNGPITYDKQEYERLLREAFRPFVPQS